MKNNIYILRKKALGGGQPKFFWSPVLVALTLILGLGSTQQLKAQTWTPASPGTQALSYNNGSPQGGYNIASDAWPGNNTNGFSCGSFNTAYLSGSYSSAGFFNAGSGITNYQCDAEFIYTNCGEGSTFRVYGSASAKSYATAVTTNNYIYATITPAVNERIDQVGYNQLENVTDEEPPYNGTYYSNGQAAVAIYDVTNNTLTQITNSYFTYGLANCGSGYTTSTIASPTLTAGRSYQIRIYVFGSSNSTTTAHDIDNPNFWFQEECGLTTTAGASPTTVCSGSSVSLTSTPASGTTPYTYTWTGSGTITTTTSQNPTAVPTASGAYSVTVTDANGCTATATTVSVTDDKATPSISATCGTNSSGVDYVQLYESTGATWLWSDTTGGRFYTSSALSVNSDSSTSHLQGPFIAYYGYYTVKITDANGCTGSGTTIINSGSCSFVLALQVLNLTVKRQGYNVQLQWQAANETTTENYVVERSTDGNNFIEAGTVPALNTGNANYSFNDDVLSVGCVPLYYRIRQLDINGEIYYSKTVMVNCNGDAAADYTLKVYPNPVQNGSMLTATFTPPAGISNLQLLITGVLGNKCYAQAITNVLPGELNTARIPINSSLMPGIYFLRIAGDKWASETIKVIKD